MCYQLSQRATVGALMSRRAIVVHDFGRRGYVIARFFRCALLPARIYRRGFDLRAFEGVPRILYSCVRHDFY